MELLKDAISNTKRLAVIHNPQHLDDELIFAQSAADLLAIELFAHPITHAGELDAALRELVANKADGIFVIASRLTNLLSEKLAKFGLNEKVPLIAAWREFTANGALLSYGPDRVSARTIGLTINQEFLLRADDLID